MRMNKAELLSAVRLAAKYQSAPTAELMNEIANRLDFTCVALSESLEQRKALAAENVGLKSYIKHECFTVPSVPPDTVQTDSFVAEMKAQGVEEFADYCSKANNGHEINPDIGEIRAFAKQLREVGQ